MSGIKIEKTNKTKHNNDQRRKYVQINKPSTLTPPSVGLSVRCRRCHRYQYAMVALLQCTHKLQ